MPCGPETTAHSKFTAFVQFQSNRDSPQNRDKKRHEAYSSIKNACFIKSYVTNKVIVEFGWLSAPVRTRKSRVAREHPASSLLQFHRPRSTSIVSLGPLHVLNTSNIMLCFFLCQPFTMIYTTQLKPTKPCLCACRCSSLLPVCLPHRSLEMLPWKRPLVLFCATGSAEGPWEFQPAVVVFRVA
jgi:hypothetical protein